MTFKKLILLLISVIFLVKGYSQESTKSTEIAKSRTVLMDKFIENDKLGVMLEMDRLMMYENDDYMALYPLEFWLLSYWLSEYSSILSTTKVTAVDSISNHSKIRIPPPKDFLGVKLVEKLTAEQGDINQRISSAKLSDEEKLFLKMNLAFILSTDNNENSQNELNILADQFLAQYPVSEYSEFTKQYIRVKYELSSTGGGVSIYSGKFLFTGELPNYYTHPTSLGLSFDFVKNNWLYQLNLAIGLGKTKTDMATQNQIWPEGSKTIGGYVNLAFGKYLINKKHLAIAPIIGVGVFGLDPNTNTNETDLYKGGGIKTKLAGSVGFTGDVLFWSKKSTEYNYFTGYNSGNNQSATSIRFGYEYIASPMKGQFIDYSGTVHKITVGIGFIGRRKQRVL